MPDAARPVLTWSPKVFLPVTNLCRDRCGYCSFRKDPGDPAAWTMAPDEVRRALDAGLAAGCGEALLCLGDHPESLYPAYRRLLAGWGHDSTVAYLDWVSREALARGLLPHTNAGVLSREEMGLLRATNASLGLMLESVSERLCGPGGPHAHAPDKRPAARLRMLEEAGELAIPFTTGLLVGIGETHQERLDTLDAIARVHARHGHVQEVIVQPFRDRPGIRMEGAPEATDPELVATIAAARTRLPPEVTIQGPPNLLDVARPVVLDAGLRDLGGISPVTPDYINPGAPWPHVDALAARCAALGWSLRPRLPVYPRWAAEERWLAPAVRAALPGVRARLAERWARADIAA